MFNIFRRKKPSPPQAPARLENGMIEDKFVFSVAVSAAAASAEQAMLDGMTDEEAEARFWDEVRPQLPGRSADEAMAGAAIAAAGARAAQKKFHRDWM